VYVPCIVYTTGVGCVYYVRVYKEVTCRRYSVCFVVERLKAHLSWARGVGAPSRADNRVMYLQKQYIIISTVLQDRQGGSNSSVEWDVNCAYNIIYICSTAISHKVTYTRIRVYFIIFFAAITQYRTDLGWNGREPKSNVHSMLKLATSKCRQV